MGGFNLQSAAPTSAKEDEGTPVELHDADGEPIMQGLLNDKPVTITVVGTYSQKYRKATDVARDKQLKRRRAMLTGDELQKQQLDITASCVLSWDGVNADEKGTPLPCTKENVIAVLVAAPWIREEVEAAMNDNARFFGKA